MFRPDLPIWRSLLFCPANSERFIAGAGKRGADGVILDLEDSVPAAEKAQARSGLASAAGRIRSGGSDVLIRINRELNLAVEDVAAAVSGDVTALVLPKIKGPEHIQLLAELIATHESRRGLPLGHTRILVLVETAAALSRINEIAAADPRVVALAVGGEDLATDLDAEPTADALYLAKMLGVHAARAAGILPIGVLASVANIGDAESYRAMLARSRALGFAGATCVHPSQAPLLNAVFAPQPAEVARAVRMVEAFEAARGRGQGAILFEGLMVDRPGIERAQRLLARFANPPGRSGVPPS